MYDSTSHITPGYRFQYQVPPIPPALSISTIRRRPASRSFAPMTTPDIPAPMMATSTSSVTGSRSTNGVKGSRGVLGEPLVVAQVVDDPTALGHPLGALALVRGSDRLRIEGGGCWAGGIHAAVPSLSVAASGHHSESERFIMPDRAHACEQGTDHRVHRQN